jgi:hypothetical protein
MKKHERLMDSGWVESGREEMERKPDGSMSEKVSEQGGMIAISLRACVGACVGRRLEARDG